MRETHLGRYCWFSSPRQWLAHFFHMIFAENPNVKVMQVASWGCHYFNVNELANIASLWAGFKLDTWSRQNTLLCDWCKLKSSALAILVYLGGLSAASGAVIVTTLALASMCLKHLILRIYRPGTDHDICRWLLWIRHYWLSLLS